MGYIDCDTHIWENDASWSYLSQAEQRYKPTTWETMNPYGEIKRMIVGVSGWTMPHGDGPLGSGAHRAHELEMYPDGTRTLTDLTSRLAHMDSVGVDVQVCHPTGWGIATIDDPQEEIALTRSYNRWMAEATAPTNGRLRWQVQGAWATPSALIEELKWGKEHGAIGLHTRGLPHFKVLTDPMYYPVWEACQELDLPVLVHVGHDSRTDPKNVDPIGVIWNIQTPVVGTFFHLLSSPDFHLKFPKLRWIFVECGAMWMPWVVQQTSRPGADLWRDENADWRKRAAEVLVERNMWVTCEPDDDIEFVIKHMGDDRLTMGSDYGHFDMGTDLGAQKQLMENETISLESRRKITDTNARELFRIDASFTPADDARLVSV